MKSTVNVYAKINLSLNVLGLNGGYHDLDSVVVSVDLCDTIKVKKSKTGEITLKMTGGGRDIPKESNNAYKAAKLFRETFSTGGVEIEIVKRIPLAGGLGGSSADSAGVLLAMAKLYGVKKDLKPLADRLGSDVAFQLRGGLARMKGRGTDLEFYGEYPEFYVLLAVLKEGVNTADCFALSDKFKEDALADNDELISDVLCGNAKNFGKNCKNGLLNAAKRINPEIETVYKLLKDTSPIAVSMTGSGSTLFGVFSSKRTCRKAQRKLNSLGVKTIVTKTIK